MTSTPSYPVSLDAQLSPELNRWLWLVKWLLVIPHIIVLAFLWIASFFLTIFAFFAILFTGKYPRGIFDYNLGVLRWTWRVGYYSYQALGTDRYPPFSLKDADYPARLEVPYPEKLSRGLALIKWWLLALPHYIIVAILHGGLGPRYGGLNLVLVIIAAVVLLFTGKYPQSIFDLVLGFNRWAFRVAVYAMLMRDEYPPFRLSP
ncbi:MAG: DUF4389 domain-containing protein [SAR202 cluster bacterium]|nr:DUF4389 domain-containing protein [SAR202 cluster bacterium]